MRDYTNIDKHLDALQKDIYHQPSDDAHTVWAVSFIDKVFRTTGNNVSSVLDVGCGIGFCHDLFVEKSIAWVGTTLDGDDIKVADTNGISLVMGSMLSIDFDDASFDMVLSRHVLEHSPAPLLSLMEYHRVATKYLALVLPTPEYWGHGGKNHYSVMEQAQIWWLLRRSGWEIVFESNLKTSDEEFMDFHLPHLPKEKRIFPGPPKIVEFQFLCKRVEEITE